MLINLVSIHPSPSPQSTPLAAAFLKSYARECAAEVDLLDFFIDRDTVVDCANKLIQASPNAIGFSMYVWNRKFICEITTAIRHIHPSITLFCGGPEVTADPVSITSTNIFDFVILGEGEVPFLSFCDALTSGNTYSEIPGILLSDSTTVLPPAPLANLDSIPSPYLSNTIDIRVYPGILWQLSRGCSFTCDFCFDSRGIHGVRYFSFERLEAELHYFVSSGVSQIFVLDSTFNVDPKRAKKILRMIKKIAPDIHFHFEVRNEFIDREMATLFAEISCSLQIGLQSSDRDVLRLVGRSFNKADFSAKTGLLNESGAVFGFDLIYGLPGDTLVGFCHSIDYALSLYPNHLDIFPLAVLPGTRLASRGTSLNLRWDMQPPYVLQETNSFREPEMAVATTLATACDIFYTRGKAVAWFNAIVSVLGLKPSVFIQKFADFLIGLRGHGVRESDFNDDEIFDLQKEFLRQLFKGKKVSRFLPLVLDLVTYHNLYAATLLAPFNHQDSDRQLPDDLFSVRFKLSPATRTARFTYEIEDLLECGEPQILWMYEHLKQTGSQAVIYRNNGIVCTESLALPYIILLEQLREKANGICLTNTGLNDEEAKDFIFFALQEGIIEIARSTRTH